MTKSETVASEYLKAIKNERPVERYKEDLTSLSSKDLEKELPTDKEKKAFWLNIYNAEVQYALKMNSSEYERRDDFFTTKRIKLKDLELSLDDIEHGILRRSQAKVFFTFMSKWFVSSEEKRLRVDKVDWRIHFALNCGAESCPAIYFYEASKIEEQLETAAGAYIAQDVDYDEKDNEVKVSKLFSWFSHDFGGEEGIRKILKKYQVPVNEKTSIRYKDYDWKLNQMKFQG